MALKLTMGIQIYAQIRAQIHAQIVAKLCRLEI